MQIAAMVKNGLETGDHILILNRAECKDMISVYAGYCKANPRMKKAKKVLKQFEDDLQVW